MSESEAPGQWRLARLQVVNWGTFGGHHDLAVPRRGLLLTGESGSGKSSLLDAMSAIMVRPGEVQFNAAANEATKGDRERSLMSYVRGAHRKQTDTDTQEIRTGYLREGPTWSAVAMTWDDDIGHRVSAARVFHVAGASLQASDLRSVYVLTDGDVQIAQWGSLVSSGIDRRRLRRVLLERPGAGTVAVDDTFTGFAPRLRRRVGIASETGQKLLHRAMSAKNLRSLDDLLRVFMLDEPETFALADTAVEQFVELRGAHDAVVDARRQVEALLPIRDAWSARREATDRGRRIRCLQEALPVFQASVVRRDAQRELESREATRRQIAARLGEVERDQDRARDELSEARRTLLDRGGADLERAQEDLVRARERADEVQAARADFEERLAALGVDLPTDRAEFAAAIELAREEARDLAATSDREQMDEPIQRKGDARREARRLERELESLARRRSRIPSDLVRVRDALAGHLGVPPASLPFAGELADIAEPEWAGAIERLMGSFARTLVVSEDLFERAVPWIDGHHLGVRLVFERAELGGGDGRASAASEPADLDPRSAARKLRMADGRFSVWMRRELAIRFPHVCVDSAVQLGDLQRALTRQGLVRDRRRHVKDDRRPIDDRSRWVIGTRNDDLVEALRGRLDEQHAVEQSAERELQTLDKAARQRRDRVRLLDQLAATRWEGIDVEGGQVEVARVQGRLRLLAAANSDLEPLRRRVEDLQVHVEALRTEENRLRGECGGLEQAIRGLRSAIEDADRILASGSSRPGASSTTGDDTDDELSDLLDELEHLARTHGRTITRETIGSLSRDVSQDLRDQDTRTQASIRQAEGRIQRAQSAYQRDWPGQMVNLTLDVESAPDYLAVLDRLQADRLPEFEGRFRDLLRDQSENNLGSLAYAIRQAPKDVRRRIDPVNRSLAQTPYDQDRGRFLSVQARPVQSGEVHDFMEDLGAVTTRAFHGGTESPEDAEARFDRMNALLDRLGSPETTNRSWRRRVLDTRLHMTFIAVERDRDGVQTDVYQGSGGRSGGQGQKLVTFCLAAALRYQLADAGQSLPRYGLVALDEAFDKTDLSFTRAGLTVFSTFGFQMLLATPLKMLQTIEEFVGGAAVVSNPSGMASSLGVIAFERGTGQVDDRQGDIDEESR
jgi:uncharacterized protein YPO0396